MAYPIKFISDICSPSKAHEDLSKNSENAIGALIMDLALSILVLTAGGCALGQVGYLANLSQTASISMIAAASGVIVIDLVLFTLKKANPDTPIEEIHIEPQPAPVRQPRAPIEVPIVPLKAPLFPIVPKGPTSEKKVAAALIFWLSQAQRKVNTVIALSLTDSIHNPKINLLLSPSFSTEKE